MCELWRLLYTGDYQFRARVIFFSSGGRSVGSGISVSHGSEASVETERSEAASNEHKLTSRMLDAKSRLYTRIRGSDPAIVLLFLFGFVLLIGLSVSLCFPAQHTPLPAKPQVEDSKYININILIVTGISNAAFNRKLSQWHAWHCNKSISWKQNSLEQLTEDSKVRSGSWSLGGGVFQDAGQETENDRGPRVDVSVQGVEFVGDGRM